MAARTLPAPTPSFPRLLARLALATLAAAAFLGLQAVSAGAAWAAPDEAAACRTCPPYDCACKEPKAPTCPPSYAPLRHLEDWSACRCVPPCERGDLTDLLKVVPLTPGGGVRASVGGQLRLRQEVWSNQGLSPADDADDNWLLGRARAHVDLEVGSSLRLFVEGIYADQWERDLGPRPVDVNQGDLLQAFVAVERPLSGGVIGGAVGRRELLFGDQRLVGPLDWANTRRTFEGGYGWWTRRATRLDAFVTRPVRIDPDGLDEGAQDPDDLFWGVHLQWDALTCLLLEGYVFGRHREDATWGGVVADEDRYTIGLRGKGRIVGTRLDWEAEGAWQLGEHGDRTILAGFATARLGWRPCLPCGDLRLATGLDWASGDGDPADNEVRSFDQLFPTGHKFFGIVDAFGRQNLLAATVSATWKPLDRLTLKVRAWRFWRPETGDAVYNVAGRVLRPASGSSERSLGSEIDVEAIWAIDRHWQLAAGYGHLFAGAFFDDAPPAEDVDFLYLSAQFTF